MKRAPSGMSLGPGWPMPETTSTGIDGQRRATSRARAKPSIEPCGMSTSVISDADVVAVLKDLERLVRVGRLQHPEPRIGEGVGGFHQEEAVVFDEEHDGKV